MEEELLRGGILLAAVIVLAIGYLVFQYIISKERDKTRKSILRKLLRVGYVAANIVAIALVLGFDVGNVWLAVASTLGLVAIGFVAGWSLIANIFAALILFTSKPFKLDDNLRIPALEVVGVVDDITLFYTVLRIDDENLLHIPNTLLLQREFVKIQQKSANKKISK